MTSVGSVVMGMPVMAAHERRKKSHSQHDRKQGAIYSPNACQCMPLG
jgi:hypothetical protein